MKIAKNGILIRTLAFAAVVTATMMGAAPARADGWMPQPYHTNGITYISGGIGIDEENAIKAQAGNYNLKITDADKQGQFTGGTNLVIRSNGGQDVIKVDNAGPMFDAQLPPGRYTVKASNGAQQEIRHIKISEDKPVDMHLIWRQS
ncbi:MAG: hypothetical protein KGI37_11315 [Alphaproteobacteria bacterium]|nr:hypothetical protein [Alphaproteobacteria bacterium]